jgi:Fur family peroxide stress response transcriptional regulator
MIKDGQARLDAIVTSLKERGYRITPQRIAVAEILARNDGHPTVKQVHDQLRRRFPTTSLVTVYKTMSLLKGMGQVLELAFESGSCRYDGLVPYPHPHLVCVTCGEILDLQVGITDEVAGEVSRTSGYRIVGHRLDFYGVCPRCQAGE